MGLHVVTKDMAKDPKMRKEMTSAPKSFFVKVSSESLKNRRIPVYPYVVK